MRILTILLSILQITLVNAQEGSALRSHISFEYGAQIPMADMKDRFGSSFNLGSQVEALHTGNGLLFGLKGYYLFGSTVKEDVLSNLRGPNGEIIGNDGAPATIALRERGFYIGPYIGKIFELSEKYPSSGIKLQVGAGLLQHHIRVQDDSRTVEQLAGEYKKGYDRLSNGLAGYGFIGYQHLDPDMRINFIAGVDITVARTESRRDHDFNLMRPENAKRTDVLAGVRLGWILPITTGVAAEKIYY